jgi:NhaA family Na+:H+ antiporter
MVALPVGCALALVWANMLPEAYYRVAHALAFPVNEIGMMLFLAVLTKEVVEATLPHGDLHPWRRAALPIAAAAGGALVPIAMYIAILKQIGEPMLVHAWMVTLAIDVGACYVLGGIIFRRHPALPFLLLVALATDALGLALLATLEPAAPALVFVGLATAVAGVVIALAMRRRRVRSFWPYVIVPGALCWYGFFLSGIHPALALVPVVPFMPHARRDAGLFVDPPSASDALTRFERWSVLPIQGVLFLFGLANAGVPMHGLEAGVWAMPAATLIGRPIGIFAGAEIAVAAGLHRHPRVGRKELIVIGCTAAVGLTVALFFATVVLPLGPLLVQLETSALLTAVGAAVAVVMAWSLGVGRFVRTT